MPLARTAPLRREIAAALPRRPFAIEFWDGTSVPATEADAPTFRFLSPEALAHVIRAPGELGLGRAYVLGLVEKADVAGPGFINVKLRKEWLAQQLRRMAADERLGIEPSAKPTIG